MRQAPSRSLRPTGVVSSGVSEPGRRIVFRTVRRRQPVKVGSDPAGHTPLTRLTESHDPINTTILAAGYTGDPPMGDQCERQSEHVLEHRLEVACGASIRRAQTTRLSRTRQASGLYVRPECRWLAGRWRIVEMEQSESRRPVASSVPRSSSCPRTATASFDSSPWKAPSTLASRTGRRPTVSRMGRNRRRRPGLGRGWAVVEPDGSLSGHLFIHLGVDSGFRVVAAQVSE